MATAQKTKRTPRTTIQTCIRIDQETWEQFRELSDVRGQSVSELVRKSFRLLLEADKAEQAGEAIGRITGDYKKVRYPILLA